MQLNDLYPIARLTQKMGEALKVSSEKDCPYTIELIRPEDGEAVIAMLKTFFFKVSARHFSHKFHEQYIVFEIRLHITESSQSS